MIISNNKAFFLFGKCIFLFHFDVSDKRRLNHCSLLIGALTFLLYLISNWKGYTNLNFDLEVTETNVSKVGDYTFGMVGIICCCFNVAYFYVKRNVLKELLQNINESYELFNKAPCKIHWLMKIYIAIYCLSGLAIGLIIISLSTTLNSLPYIYYFGYSGSVIDAMHFLSYVCLREIGDQIAHVNEILVTSKMNSKSSMMEKVVIAADYHYKIVSLSKKANNILGLSNATIFVYYFVGITLSVHYVVQMVVRQTYEGMFYSCILNIIFITTQTAVLLDAWNSVSIRVSLITPYSFIHYTF